MYIYTLTVYICIYVIDMYSMVVHSLFSFTWEVENTVIIVDMFRESECKQKGSNNQKGRHEWRGAIGVTTQIISKIIRT